MRVIWIFLALLIYALPYNAQAVEAASPAQDGQFNQLKIQGDFVFSNLTVAGETIITGNARGIDSFFSNLEIGGSAKITRTNITDQLNIVGDLFVRQSNVESLVSSGNVVILRDSKVKKIIFKESKLPQRLMLKGLDVVGDIIFESGNGLIEISNGAVVTGQVLGAVIVNN